MKIKKKIITKKGLTFREESEDQMRVDTIYSKITETVFAIVLEDDDDSTARRALIACSREEFATEKAAEEALKEIENSISSIASRAEFFFSGQVEMNKDNFDWEIGVRPTPVEKKYIKALKKIGAWPLFNPYKRINSARKALEKERRAMKSGHAPALAKKTISFLLEKKGELDCSEKKALAKILWKTGQDKNLVWD